MATSRRPGGVTLVSILAWISGLLQVITGILLLITGTEGQVLAITGWILGILGLITIIVGAGLWSGNRAARIIATIVFSLNLINAVVGAFNATGASVWSFWVNALLAVIGLILLWTKAATDFFRS
ncbi:hypothetical protein P0L94_00995 [Microbacter sp. GSS18]|nr:hypothetical protein P0L94_00995 [Microbacter sp. GSS18]